VVSALLREPSLLQIQGQVRGRTLSAIRQRGIRHG
jgi:hypothetical protein